MVHGGLLLSGGDDSPSGGRGRYSVNLLPLPKARSWLLLLVSCLGCTDRTVAPASQPTARPSVLLVALDTFRADALGYEGGAAATPFIDSLVLEGVRFDQAYTTAPTGLPGRRGGGRGCRAAGGA